MSLDMKVHATTVLSVRRGDYVAMAGDGQVTMDQVIAKADAVKIRRLEQGGQDNAGVLLGFAGAAADAFGVVPSLVGCSLVCAAYGLALFAWQPKPLEAASN